jgi:RHS repeat-associated protein
MILIMIQAILYPKINPNHPSEPNAGTYNYTYDAFGQMLTQDANGKISSLAYDKLGRVLTLTETEGTTTYTWDTKTKGKGLIAAISSTNGASEDYNYDTYGRLSSKTEVINGQSYAESIQYDSYGRLSQLTYPSNFAVTYNYNTNCYLSEIKRADNSTSVWKAESMNARRQIMQTRSGNNLVTTYSYNQGFVTGIQTGTVQNLQYGWNTASGNLSWRKDAKRNLTENFTYDNLNRLTQVAISGGATNTYSYSANGNIAGSTPAGTYSYDATKLHALKSVTNPNNLISTTDQTVEYTSFDKVKKITEGINELNISYGVAKQRGMTVYKENSVEKKRKYFAHGNYEKITESGATRELHYIAWGAGLAAIFQKRTTGDTMFYVHTDHLGSLNGITDQTGAVKEELSFDAWGRRRNPANWTFTGIPSYYRFDRGYTGHEQLDKLGLINMNGRMYDPVVGRFLSVDPFVQPGGGSQGYNRYSYCLNNPLKYTDPSGFIRDDCYNGNMARLPNRDRPLPFVDGGYSHNWGGGSQNESYWYDWGDTCYRNSKGEMVSYWEVHNNYIVPNSIPPENLTQAERDRINFQVELFLYQSAGFKVAWSGNLYDTYTVGLIDLQNWSENGWNAVIQLGKPMFGFCFASKDDNNWLSDLWNNSIISKIIPDVIYINQGSIYNFVGGAGYTSGYALPIRGKDAFHLYSTFTLLAKVGAHGSIGINIGYSSYVGDARNFDFDVSFGGKGTRGFDSDIILGISGNVSVADQFGGILYSYSIGLGPSIGASLNIGSETYVKRIW